MRAARRFRRQLPCRRAESSDPAGARPCPRARVDALSSRGPQPDPDFSGAPPPVPRVRASSCSFNVVAGLPFARLLRSVAMWCLYNPHRVSPLRGVCSPFCVGLTRLTHFQMLAFTLECIESEDAKVRVASGDTSRRIMKRDASEVSPAPRVPAAPAGSSRVPCAACFVCG